MSIGPGFIRKNSFSANRYLLENGQEGRCLGAKQHTQLWLIHNVCLVSTIGRRAV